MPDVESARLVGNVGVRSLLISLWRRRWVVLITTVFFAALGAAYVAYAREWYQANTVLMIADNGGATSVRGQLGSLASLAGINPMGAGNLELPIAILRSRDLVREFIEEEGLTAAILEREGDPSPAGRKVGDGKVFDVRDAVDRFQRRVLRISEDKTRGTIILSVSWTDPGVAAEWADKIVTRVNAKLRDQAIKDAEENIEYLRRELSASAIPVLQQSAGELLESELQKLMLARGSMQYAFKVIDPASVPKNPSRPQPIVVMLAAVLLGIFVSLALVIFDVIAPSLRGAFRPGSG